MSRKLPTYRMSIALFVVAIALGAYGWYLLGSVAGLLRQAGWLVVFVAALLATTAVMSAGIVTILRKGQPPPSPPPPAAERKPDTGS